MADTTAKLLELPNDLLSCVAEQVAGLHELGNLFCTCRRMRELACQPNIIAAACMRASVSCQAARALFTSRDETFHLEVIEQIWRKQLDLHQEEQAGRTPGRLCSPINWDEWALTAVELRRVHVAAWLYACVPLEDEEEQQLGGVAAATAEISGERELDVLPEEAEILPDAPAVATTAAPGKHVTVGSCSQPRPWAATRVLGISRYSGGNTLTPTQAGCGAGSSSAAAASLLNRHSARGEVGPSTAAAGPRLGAASSRPASSSTSTFSLVMPSMKILARNSRTIAGAPNFPLGHPLGYQAAAIRRISGAVAGAGASASGDAAAQDGGPDTLLLANVHFKGDAALRHACHAGDVCLTRMLLAHGADANARDGMPLALAAGGGHLQVARVLLEEAGADCTAGNHKALAAAIASEAKASTLEMIALLLAKGADVHASDNFALRWACAHNKIDVARVLIENGADVHAGVEDALYQASKNGHLAAVQLLLASGADAKRCQDAVARARERGHDQIVEVLKEAQRSGLIGTMVRGIKKLVKRL